MTLLPASEEFLSKFPSSRYLSSSGSYLLDLSGVGDPAGSKATADLALRVTGTHQPLHQDKASGGMYIALHFFEMFVALCQPTLRDNHEIVICDPKRRRGYGSQIIYDGFTWYKPRIQIWTTGRGKLFVRCSGFLTNIVIKYSLKAINFLVFTSNFQNENSYFLQNVCITVSVFTHKECSRKM